MKTIETTQTETKTITTYECETCGKTFDSYHAKYHEGAHSFEEKRETPKNTFFRFSSKEQYTAFTKSDSGYHAGRWEGPGWYGYRIEDDYCKGCYMGQIMVLYPAQDFMDDCREWMAEAKAIAEITGISVNE